MAAVNLDENIYGSEISYLIKNLLEGKKLEKWQRYFCRMANIFVCCVDSNGEPLTEFGGDLSEVQRVLKAVNKDQLQNMLLRVSESTLEDQTIETGSYPNLRLAVVTAKTESKPVLSWLICGVLSDASDASEEEEFSGVLLTGFENTLTEREFENVVDIVRNISEELICHETAVLSIEAEKRKSRDSEKKMKAAVKRMEALAEVVQLLENDDAVEGVMVRMMGTVGRSLDISSAALCQAPDDADHMHIVAHWCNKDRKWLYEGEVRPPKPFFLRSEKVFIVSDSSNLTKEEQAELEGLGIRSIIVLPVVRNGSINMYACFIEQDRKRSWEVEEIKFLNDAVKILQSVLTRRKQKNSLEGFYSSFEAILNQVEGAVYVKDVITGAELFLNRSMRSQFERELQDGSINDLLKQQSGEEDGISEFFLESRAKWYRLSYGRIKWIDGNPAFLYIFYDETEKKISQRKIEQHANVDSLTAVHDLIQKADKYLDMEKNMRKVTAKDYHQFEIYFQPIIDIQKKRCPCMGAEALIRWNNAELGFVLPSEFIPLIEYLGLMNPIGNYVLKEACQYCKGWNDNGYPHYKISVNLSVLQLMQEDIAKSVEKIIEETKINPGNLILEITERLAVNDMERMKEILEKIKKLGVKIALDDFGTGYSSSNYIKEMPFDMIKVDQSLIRNLETDIYARSFIQMAAELAQEAGTKLCVEGVETKKQLEIISGMHVDQVQGYYFNKPMQRAEFEKKYTPKLFKQVMGKRENEISTAGTVQSDHDTMS